MAAPKIRWKALISRRYWEPPCRMPKVFSMSPAGEGNRPLLLPDGQGSQEDGRPAVLPPGQAIGEMTGHL